jgi:ADP-heptose:LPS heptosyltransferase
MHLLVIRTSSMGDVALSAPVIASIKKQYPEIKITLLTRPAFIPFFRSITGLQIFPSDFEKRHKGLPGIIRLYRDIKKKERIDHVIDLHNVIRSKILRWLFRLSGVKVSVIDKGRAEKEALIKGKNKVQLKHSVERYLDVFSKAGLPALLVSRYSIIPPPEAFQKVSIIPGMLNIGVAPYAKHTLKIWPDEYMTTLLAMISEKQNTRFWLFGGKEDIERLKAFSKKVPGSFNVAGNYTLSEELALMSKLDFMITMDSANMHMASLVGTKVISIWGGTDPLAGFGAWQQPDEFSLRIPVNELKCRPCTVFGKGKCHRVDFACMIWLAPEKVFKTINKLGIFPDWPGKE